MDRPVARHFGIDVQVWLGVVGHCQLALILAACLSRAA